MANDAAHPASSPEELDGQSITLMRLVKQGDENAFRELVECHQHAVIGTCAKMLGNIDDAHDIAQQVFLRVWKAAPRYEPSAKFTTWLFTILRHLVFNETRRKQRRPTVSLDEKLHPDDDRTKDIPDNFTPAPDSSLLHQELEKAIDRAIDALPENQRLAVVLRRYEEMPYEEIAAVLKTSVPSVKSLLFRARTQLRESLRAYLDTGEGE
ncbi:MAG: RNA polymerase sigma factor [Verrucomicrobiales bacterium]